MKLLRLPATILASLPLAATSAWASFSLLGTDDFGDGTLDIGEGYRWTYSSDINVEVEPGTFFTANMWSESGGRLHLTNEFGVEGFIGWTTPQLNANGFNNDLLISTSVTIAGAGVGVDYLAGLRLYTWSENASGAQGNPFDRFDTNAFNARYNVMIDSNGDNPLVYLRKSIWDGDSWNNTSAHYNVLPSVTDITLGMFLVSGELFGYWQTAGEPNVYNIIGSFEPFGSDAGAAAIYQNGFGLELFGTYPSSGLGMVGEEFSGISTGISFGSMNVQSLSAVPEPSTYAAIAGGLMLGFAAWRRRARPTATPAA